MPGRFEPTVFVAASRSSRAARKEFAKRIDPSPDSSISGCSSGSGGNLDHLVAVTDHLDGRPASAFVRHSFDLVVCSSCGAKEKTVKEAALAWPGRRHLQ